MIITLLAKKGGVGKSSVCLLLHEAFKRAGKTVAIKDCDAQGTSNKALVHIKGQKADPEGAYEVLLYDTPPNLEHPVTTAAVRAADLVLIVASPSPADVWEIEEAVEFARSKNKAAA